MNCFKKHWLLIVILILASLLRFWKLGSYPALNADEAAIGYNAYSLIRTGLDEHGNTWPIHFQSFNDYKPGLYFYIVLPFIRFIGLNELAVRIPGAAMGILTVLAVYLLVMELFDDRKFAAISALFLTVSPWHLQFSRGGWEVNAATFFMVLGLWLFIRALKKPNILNYIFSAVPLVLSLYTYHAARVVAPLLTVALLIINWKTVSKSLKPLLIALILGILLLLPLARDLFSSNALSRVAGVGLFADQGPINRINEQRGEHGSVNSIVGKLIHNKIVNYSLAFAENWASHYHGLFLFVSGDVIQRNAVPETGEMYLFDILFVVAGLFLILKQTEHGWRFLLSWLIIGPIASALTFQSPNALRAQNMVIPLTVISAYGFLKISSWLEAKNLKVLFLLLVIFMLWQFARYEHMYWVHMAKEYPFSSQYGVKELVEYVTANQSRYQKVYITDKYDQPYILFLFYTKYPPRSFQGNHMLTARDNFGFSTVRDFGKYHFEALDFSLVLSQHPNVMIAASPDEVPKGSNVIKRIYGSNGYEYFDIISN